MIDLNFLSQEARSIHTIFESIFYGMAIVLLLIAVLAEFLSMPIGGLGWTPQLLGRILIAAFLLHTYPEFTNALADFTDALTAKIGGFNELHHVLDRMGDKLKDLTWSWMSVKDTLILGFSFITFFLLYISVFIANAGVIFVWLILYVFSPLLIVFFVIPSTSQITKGLYRALIEVCAWKIIWATLAALLWSLALSEINKTDVNFLTVISLNIILALSLLFTPFVVSAMTSKGLTSVATTAMGMAAGAAAFTPGAIASKLSRKTISAGIKHTPIGFEKTQKETFTSKVNEPTYNYRSTNSSKTKTAPNRTNDAPPSKAPPPWLQAKLDKEKSRKDKNI